MSCLAYGLVTHGAAGRSVGAVFTARTFSDRGLHHEPPCFARRPQECASDYQEMVADKCCHCNKGVRKAGGFSGSFYPVDRKPGHAEGEEGEAAKVHLECFEAYQAKLAEEGEGKAAALETVAAEAAVRASAAEAAADAPVAKPEADAETRRQEPVPPS